METHATPKGLVFIPAACAYNLYLSMPHKGNLCPVTFRLAMAPSC